MKSPPSANPPCHNLGLSEKGLCALLIDLYAQKSLGFSTPLADRAPAFDPIFIRNLIREAAARGKHPAQLILGREEADAYREFLRHEYQEEAPKHLKDSYFLGLQIVVEDTPSKLALSGEKSHDAWEGRLPPPWHDDVQPSP